MNMGKSAVGTEHFQFHSTSTIYSQWLQLSHFIDVTDEIKQ